MSNGKLLQKFRRNLSGSTSGMNSDVKVDISREVKTEKGTTLLRNVGSHDHLIMSSIKYDLNRPCSWHFGFHSSRHFLFVEL